MGYWGIGCQTLSRRSSAMLPREPNKATTEGNQDRFSEQRAQDPPARGSEREAQSDFTGAVGGARGKQAAQVGACGEQNQTGKEHHSCHESLHTGPEQVAGKRWAREGVGHPGIVFGVGFFQVGAYRVEIGDGLGLRHSRLDMPQHHENVALPAIVQDIDALNLFLLDHGRPEVGVEEDQSSVEVRRRDAEDGKGVLVHLDDAAHDVAIVLKMGVPIRPGED